MDFVKFAYFLFFVSSVSSESENGPVTLSTKLNGLSGIPFFGRNFPFNLFQFLPNPAYHGFEKRNTDKDSFTPQKDCNHEHTNLTVGSSGVITSPNYPKNYPAGLRCQWSFQSEPGTVIRLTFFDIVTQPWFLTFYDYLAVSLNGKWDSFYRLTGDMNRIAPISLESKGNNVGIRFTSGFDFFNYRGFKMAYVVTRRQVADDGTQISNDTTPPTVDYGNSSDVTAICDYLPITLPPDSTGEIPKLQRIVGGSEATPHEFPFTVAMIMDDTKFCSGTLIDGHHVLTAAHCVPEGTKKVELYFGVHDMRKDEDSRQYRVVDPQRFVTRHPNYDPLTSANDIAVIKFKRQVTTTAFVQPVYLPTAYSMGNSFKNWKLITMGWGDDIHQASGIDEHPITPVLMKATMPVIPNEECRKTYSNLITGNMLCTEVLKGGGAPCRGDAGGPLVAKFSRTQNTAEDVPAVVNDDNQVNQCFFTKSHRDRYHQEKIRPVSRTSDWFVQLGVLSFGTENCGNGSPVAFTRVTAYLDFISNVVSQDSL